MKPALVEVPSLVLAYTKFINGVERFYQLRTLHATERVEERVSMPIFTLPLEMQES